MHQTLVIIMGILLFAGVTSCLYIIGLRKKMTENQRLTEMLLNNGALRVRKYLKRYGYIREEEISSVIQNVKAHEFGSRKMAMISSGVEFQEQLIEYMLDHNYLLKTKSFEGENLYYLP